MKNKLIQNTVLFLLGFILMYLLTSFVNFDLNSSNWTEKSRMFVSVFGLMSGMAFLLINTLGNEK